MIAVKLEGRLGNQLFQYAFIYSAAKKINTSFYLDQSIDHLKLSKYFEIEKGFCPFLDDHIFSIKGYKNLFSHYLRRYYYYFLKQILSLKEVAFSNNLLPAVQSHMIKNGCIYTGFFQSEEYFSFYKDDIKKQFIIRENHRRAFDALFSTLPFAPRYIVIHIRRGDYLSHNYALPSSYYHNAIKRIHNDENYYIFISDDVAFVEAEFAYLSNIYISASDEIIDFQFLINADICILSNSSFSWWGAFLNNKLNKIVYAPKNWLGFKEDKEQPVRVTQKEWNLLKIK